MRKIFSVIIASALMFSTMQALSQEPPGIVDVTRNSFSVVHGVNIRNGNFAVSYLISGDDSDPAGVPFKITYNSLSSYQGKFGVGWGSAWDTRMLYMPDGSVIVHENGTGSYTVYNRGSDAEINAGIEEILKAVMAKDPSALTDEMLVNLKDIKNGDGARFEAVMKYGPRKPMPVVSDLAVYIYSIFNNDYCYKESTIDHISNEHYPARFFPFSCAKPVEYFNDDGTINNLVLYTSNENKEGDERSLEGERDGPVIKKLIDEKGSVTKFTYNKKRELIQINYPGGNLYKYAYDSRGNMTTITYVDESKRLITYDKVDRVTSVTERSGDIAKFEYLPDPYDPSVSLTRVTDKVNGATYVTIFKLQR